MLEYRNHIVNEDLNRLINSLPDCKSMYNTSVLITGATGMIATYCIYFFLYLNDTFKANIRVTGLVRDEKKAHLRFFDIVDRDDFTLLVQDVTTPFEDDLQLDYILHMAGSASAYAITHDPIGIIEANVVGTINVMELAKRRNTCRVLFASTREVYGKLADDVNCITEDMQGTIDQTNTRSCYPESKRMAENVIATYASMHGLDTVIARIAHVYGPGMALHDDGRIMADLMNNAISGEDIVLKSDGSAKRAFCYITDAIDALIRICISGEKNAIYNVANEQEEVTILSLANMICKCDATGDIKVTFCELSASEKKGYLGLPRTKLSTAKMVCLGWSPQVSLKDGIQYTIGVMK